MNNIDWKAFETNMSLMLINMKLESLPTDLEKLVDKSYELADNAEKDLKKESEKTFADIEKMPEVIEETSDGEPFCEKNWIESQAEDYFCEQNGIIELYNKSINLMLINFFGIIPLYILNIFFYFPDLCLLQSLHNIWQFSAVVFPPECHGVMWSPSISSISKCLLHSLHIPFCRS